MPFRRKRKMKEISPVAARRFWGVYPTVGAQHPSALQNAVRPTYSYARRKQWKIRV